MKLAMAKMSVEEKQMHYRKQAEKRSAEEKNSKRSVFNEAKGLVEDLNRLMCWMYFAMVSNDVYAYALKQIDRRLDSQTDKQTDR